MHEPNYELFVILSLSVWHKNYNFAASSRRARRRIKKPHKAVTGKNSGWDGTGMERVWGYG